ncbi:carbon-nitrogen hydrolase family protein [Fulvivirgaceae bacterium BMA10]|uniref:Carbon-nitrogen hydrolase family protein n=1 Tax=Splendidivirga corallicola TaxID=3051826 RepID=A0ABT8KR54_9BACT|nr:carbon-nitrogen hydrolase family protein [Fulvivirgaceae bacterium BMA10]
MKNFKVAVVQSSPILFNLGETILKVGDLVGEASTQGAKLILFPEAFIPAYPRGLTFGTIVGSRSKEGRELWLKYWENAIEIPSSEIDVLGNYAKKAGAYLAIGVIEREAKGGTLYCTLLYFGPNGDLLGKHRKLKPTASERIIWGEGDGSTLSTFDTEFGTIGGLICWENYMPLARMAMYRKGVDIYLAPTADHRDTWQATMQHIALEGRCFVLACNQFVTKDQYPKDLPGLHELENQPEVMTRGGSVIISPMGEVMAGPLFGKEGVLYADIDMHEIGKSKMDFDVIGHYARHDVFDLTIHDQPETVSVNKHKEC